MRRKLLIRSLATCSMSVILMVLWAQAQLPPRDDAPLPSYLTPAEPISDGRLLAEIHRIHLNRQVSVKTGNAVADPDSARRLEDAKLTTEIEILRTQQRLIGTERSGVADIERSILILTNLQNRRRPDHHAGGIKP